MNSKVSLANDLRVLCELLTPRQAHATQRDQLSSFYERQAEHYDNFRDRLLWGRQALVEELIPRGFSGVWIDIGGGTGRTVEFVADRISPAATVIILDLCQPLLAIAEKRIAERQWHFAQTCFDDITSCSSFSNSADVVTFCYSLTMIPRWEAALAAAQHMLRPGGRIGIVDFTCIGDRTLHGRLRDLAWRLWFSYDGVKLSKLHHLEAQRRFTPERLTFSTSRIPYLPGLRAPFYTFSGRRT
jgi:S-adenosylmethionine-diacylgycerolhomoserine-N-methlytransferase